MFKLICLHSDLVRLWCLLMWTCLIVYKGHLYPVWDVEFSPYGYYFVSGGQDKTARLWCTDDYKPLRLFSGHAADVDVNIIKLLINFFLFTVIITRLLRPCGIFYILKFINK